MHAKTLVIPFLMALALASGGLLAQGLPIGVVDMRKVEDSFDLAELHAELAREEEAIKKECEKLQTQGNKLVADSEALQQGTLEHSQMVGQIEAVSAQIKFLQTKVLELHKEVARAKFMERRHLLIVKRIEEVAAQKGLLLVLKVRAAPTPEQVRDPRARMMILGEKEVLFHHASLDITQDVIRLLKLPEKPAGENKQGAPAPASDSKSK